MDIEIIDDSGDTLEFELDGVEPAFANALRRTMIGDVPTLAVEEVAISANNSGLFDEIIAHRIGTLPWEFDPDQYELPEECDCEEGCSSCEVAMALQVEGEGEVTASDISVPADDVDAANPDTKIVDLKEDGELEAEMVAHLGLGREHAKWQAANASYAYEDDTFHFNVESVSGLDPRTIVMEAVRRLDRRAEHFQASLQEDL